MSSPQVAIVMGSDSDAPAMQAAALVLQEFGVAHTVHVLSAHRTPEALHRYLRRAEAAGVKVFIAGAGGAAHLAGVVASQTVRPVIGVPLEGSSLKGLDALLSTVQMPGGVPVATVAIGTVGAKNAGVLAVQILATGRAALERKLRAYKRTLAEGVLAKNAALQRDRGQH